MPRHKLAIFCHNLEINGANYFVYTLAVALKKRARITVLSPKDGAMKKRFIDASIECTVIDDSFDFSGLVYFDVVFVNSLMMSRIVLECIQYSVPHILIVHETWVPEKINYYLNELWNINSITSSDIIMALEGSQKVIFPAKYLQRVYESLVGNDRSDTIYCTIEMGMIDKYCSENNRREVRSNMDVAGDEVLFLQVGTVTRRKAQMTTLLAFSEICKRASSSEKLKLFFVGARAFRPGEREYINEIEGEIVRLGLEEQVRIFSVHDDIYKYYRSADILVHPSINEVLPLSILEACYFKMSVIVSNLDGMPEVIRDRVDGLLVNPYDINTVVCAMQELAENPSLRKRLGISARDRVYQQHAISMFENNYSNLVDELLETNTV